jgi:hypothetical protein
LVQRGRVVGEALEAQQLGKTACDRLDLLVNGHLDAVHIDRADAELGLLVVLAQAVQPGRSRPTRAAPSGIWPKR